MNTEVLGVNGQLVTTWGRELVGGVIVGGENPLRWTCACRCGKKAFGSGFSSHSKMRDVKWSLFGDEWFCSDACAIQHDRDAVERHIHRLSISAMVQQSEAGKLADKLASHYCELGG